MHLKTKKDFAILCAIVICACVLVFHVSRLAQKTRAQTIVSPTPATTLAGNGSPTSNSITCGIGLASTASATLYVDDSVTTGNAIWKCATPDGVTFNWVQPFVSPVLAVATTGTFASQSFLLGGCTSVQTVTISGATVGTNAATASPIFTSAPTVNIGPLNTVAWVSAANTVSVQACALAALSTIPSFQAKVLLY
jgi:hypothetical protein